MAGAAGPERGRMSLPECIKIKWYATASLSIAQGNDAMLFDPFLPLRGSEITLSPRCFDGFFHIFITHGHFDHIEAVPGIVARNRGVTVYCTKAPYDTLRRKGVPAENLRHIRPGEVIRVGDMSIRVYPGRHAVLPGISARRVKYLLRSPHKQNLFYIVRENRRCREKDETVLYRVETGGRKIIVMGSLNLRRGTCYPAKADLLILPYNGWDDNFRPAMEVIQRLQPRRVLLDHFDDAFPPITMPIDTRPIREYLGERVIMAHEWTIEERKADSK